MTQPVVHGYPDWHRVVAQSDVRYCDIQEIIGGITTKGPFFVGTSPALALQFRAVSGPLSALISFYNDPAMLQFLGQYEIHLAAAGVAYNQAVPILGPYLGVDLVPTGAGIEYVLRAWGVPTESRFGRLADDLLIVAGGVAVGAGAGVTLNATKTRPGQAHWQIHTALASFVATLQIVDAVGNVTQLASRQNPANNEPYLVYLPAATPRVTFTNLTGAAGTFNAHLIARPIAGGW